MKIKILHPYRAFEVRNALKFLIDSAPSVYATEYVYLDFSWGYLTKKIKIRAFKGGFILMLGFGDYQIHSPYPDNSVSAIALLNELTKHCNNEDASSTGFPDIPELSEMPVYIGNESPAYKIVGMELDQEFGVGCIRFLTKRYE